MSISATKNALTASLQAATGVANFAWYGGRPDPVNNEVGYLWPVSLTPTMTSREETEWRVAIAVWRADVGEAITRLSEIVDGLVATYSPNQPQCLPGNAATMVALQFSEPAVSPERSHLNSFSGVYVGVEVTLRLD